VPGFCQAVTAYFDALTALGMRLLRLLALSLGLPGDYFTPYFTHPMVALRPLHYTAEVGCETRPHSCCWMNAADACMRMASGAW
jgi:isopenicillin N synthase-like dioxygenase